MKTTKLITVITLIIMLLIINVPKAWSYPKELLKTMPCTNVHVYSIREIKDVFQKKYYQQDWVPIKEAFSNITKNISRDNCIAYVTNNNRTLVLNFSEEDSGADDSYLFVPNKYKRYVNGTVKINGNWLFRLFEETEKIYCFNNDFKDNWFKSFNKVVKNEYERFFCEYNWIPVREVFGKFMDRISWNHSNKVACISNNDRELIFNFSGEEFETQYYQFSVPEDQQRLIKGRTCINAYWLAWIFDMHEYESYSDENLAKQWFTPEREQLKQSLQFLDILETSYIYDRRSDVFNMFMKFEGGPNK